MADIKYTTDGKKVAIVGKLNNVDWIVQEIYVSGELELPAGEHFLCSNLLDAPAISWKQKAEYELENRCVNLKLSVKTIEDQIEVLNRTRRISTVLNKVISAHGEADIAQLETLFDFIGNRITHVVTDRYGTIRIEEFSKFCEATEGSRHDGLRLVSLFGCNSSGKRHDTDKLSLSWRINRYRDDSGDWVNIFPCKSLNAAIATVDSLIKDRDANESLIKLKHKHGLKNPTEYKIKEYELKVSEGLHKSIDAKQKEIEQLRDKLNHLK